MMLERVVPFGRSLDEYKNMFALVDGDLSKNILGVGDGPASFNAEMFALGKPVVSVDPLYIFREEQIEKQFYSVVDDIISQVKAGRLKALAITSAKRSSALPDVPTVAEGGIRDFDVSAWNGLIAPARIADDIVNKIHNDVTRIALSKEFADIMQPQALEIDLMRPEAFRNFLAAELAKWSKLVKDSGAKID